MKTEHKTTIGVFSMDVTDEKRISRADAIAALSGAFGIGWRVLSAEEMPGGLIRVAVDVYGQSLYPEYVVFLMDCLENTVKRYDPDQVRRVNAGYQRLANKIGIAAS